MSGISDTYTFKGQEQAYVRFRPNWTSVFALDALRRVGFAKDLRGFSKDGAHSEPPNVACIGAGTGSEAAVFKELGCSVFLVEPNDDFLKLAEENLRGILQGQATYINSNAMQTFIPEKVLDLIVVAQAAHTLKHTYAEKFLTPEQRQGGHGTEELTRLHWKTLLRNRDSDCISIWYYNPDPREQMTRDLDRILSNTCPRYKSSKTPLLNADYFTANNFQPWISCDELKCSKLMPIKDVVLSGGMLADWLSSYSFKPTNDAEMSSVCGILKREWFDHYQRDGLLTIPYVGVVFQGKLRDNAFPVEEIGKPISVKSPLDISFFETNLG